MENCSTGMTDVYAGSSRVPNVMRRRCKGGCSMGYPAAYSMWTPDERWPVGPGSLGRLSVRDMHGVRLSPAVG